MPEPDLLSVLHHVALGTVEVLGTSFNVSKLTLVIEFLLMAATLAVRPFGLLGKSPVQKAEEDDVEQRVDEHGKQRVAHRAAVAQIIDDLLANDDPQAP